jgi:hypothetical protein
VVELVAQNPKIEGLNPSFARDEIQKVYVCLGTMIQMMTALV